MTDRDEPFLSRWSRLKRESAAGTKEQEAPAGRDDVAGTPHGDDAAGPAPTSAQDREAEAGAGPQRTELKLEEIDFDKLDSTSDYKPFMSANVPDEIRQKALSKLWLSDPVLGGPEQLSDYMEDFSDAARAVTGGVLRTAYKIGQGFLSDEEAAEWDRLGRKEPAATPGSAEIVVLPESLDEPEIAALLAASDADAQSRDPSESSDHLDLAALTASDAQFFVARRNGKALGCCALINAGDGSGAVKRMWVEPDARGQGVGRRLLETIEAAAREDEIAVLRLETGIRQVEAIGFFRKLGFNDCEPFGEPKPDSTRLFMEKRLS